MSFTQQFEHDSAMGCVCDFDVPCPCERYVALHANDCGACEYGCHCDRHAYRSSECECSPKPARTQGSIAVRYSAIDGYGETRRFKTIAGAARYGRRWIGNSPDLGTTYAVSADGIGKITVSGAALTDLFPT